MHANYHRKDSAIIQEGFQRFRATENCKTPSCVFMGQKTTHFHCRRAGCSFTFKNKSDMGMLISARSFHTLRIRTLDDTTLVSMTTRVNRYRNISILDFIGSQDGGDYWSYKTWKVPVKLSPPTNQTLCFLHTGCPSCRPTNSVKALYARELHRNRMLLVLNCFRDKYP